MTQAGAEQFMRRLVERFAELEPQLAEHRRDNRDQILAHVFMGDVKRWFVQAYRDGRVTDASAFAGWLEAEYEAGPPDTRNVIEVSFLYDLPWPPEADADDIKRLLPPRLATKLASMQDWRPSR
jgi:hypothetical protein